MNKKQSYSTSGRFRAVAQLSSAKHSPPAESATVLVDRACVLREKIRIKHLEKSDWMRPFQAITSSDTYNDMTEQVQGRC